MTSLRALRRARHHAARAAGTIGKPTALETRACLYDPCVTARASTPLVMAAVSYGHGSGPYIRRRTCARAQ